MCVRVCVRGHPAAHRDAHTHTLNPNDPNVDESVDVDVDIDDGVDDGDEGVLSDHRAVLDFQTCSYTAANTCGLVEPSTTTPRPRLDKMADITRYTCNGEYNVPASTAVVSTTYRPVQQL